MKELFELNAILIKHRLTHAEHKLKMYLHIWRNIVIDQKI